jgi:NAD(P)H-nitrite reductase large subunit
VKLTVNLGLVAPCLRRRRFWPRVCSARLRQIFTGRRRLRLKVTGIDLFSAGDVQGRER